MWQHSIFSSNAPPPPQTHSLTMQPLHHLALLLTTTALSPASVLGRAAPDTKRDDASPAATASAVNTTTCNGRFYAYTELAGYGYVPADARDRFGDTIGGIGSAVALEPGSWARSTDGTTYTGLLWALPDRGW